MYKKTSTAIITIFVLLLTSSSKCKKENTNNFITCACNKEEIKYILEDVNGTLSYYQYNKRWMLSYSPLPGNISNFFPCNTNQDSLKIFIAGASSTQIFPVKFSGKVKAPCPDEVFGITSGVTTFDYIIVDSIKRN